MHLNEYYQYYLTVSIQNCESHDFVFPRKLDELNDDDS